MIKKDYTGIPLQRHALLGNSKAGNNKNENRPGFAGRSTLCFDHFALHGCGEDQSILATIHFYHIPFAELPGKDFQRQRILQFALDGSLERTSTKCRVITFFRKEFLRFAADFQIVTSIGKQLADTPQLEIHDFGELIPGQRMEDYDLVNTVEEFGAKMVLQHAVDRLAR